MVVGGSGGSVMYAASGGVVYAASPHTTLPEGAAPLLLNLPHGLQVTHDQNGSATAPLVTLPMALTSAALQQSAAAAAAVVSAASVAATASTNNSSNSNNSSQAGPTDLSMPIKREKWS
ncbi:uncharacterized protein [Cherax quadricarinatus]|uniref:uncharacterized protein n=1 Tax=Cherax quadricarinatus TaxID=27406 RepID=UPI00387E6881